MSESLAMTGGPQLRHVHESTR